MQKQGVTLRLAVPAHLSSIEAAEALRRSLPLWIDGLAEVDGPTRVVLDDPRGDLDALGAQSWSLADAPGGGDVIVLADAVDVPGPHLVQRLAAAAGGGHAVDARLLPVGHGADDAAAGVCVALDAETWAELGRPSAPALPAIAEERGLQLTSCLEATVFRDVRFLSDGLELPREAVNVTATIHPSTPASGHPAALPATSLAVLAADVGFSVPDADRDDRPFLTVVTRTQGQRLQCLAEMFTCLAAQTVQDFEVVLACHRVDPDALARVRAVVDAQPESLRRRIRVLEVERPGRAAPLNAAFEVAAGRYVVVLDDDDTVLGHWVETFRDLEQDHAGQVLRAGALRQDVVATPVHTPGGSVVCPAPTTAARPEWPAEFSLLDHFYGNHSPFMTLAFPRGLFHDLPIRFDESLDTTEDWDFVLRTVTLVGVANSTELTSVYRWWTGAGSRTLHDIAAWKRAEEVVRRGLDGRTVLLPPHTLGEIEQRRLDVRRAWLRLVALEGLHQNLLIDYQNALAAHDHAVAARDSLESQTERLRAERDEAARRHRKHLRMLREGHEQVRRTGVAPPDGTSLFDMTPKELRRFVARLRDLPGAGTGQRRLARSRARDA